MICFAPHAVGTAVLSAEAAARFSSTLHLHLVHVCQPLTWSAAIHLKNYTAGLGTAVVSINRAATSASLINSKVFHPPARLAIVKVEVSPDHVAVGMPKPTHQRPLGHAVDGVPRAEKIVEKLCRRPSISPSAPGFAGSLRLRGVSTSRLRMILTPSGFSTPPIGPCIMRPSRCGRAQSWARASRILLWIGARRDRHALVVRLLRRPSSVPCWFRSGISVVA